MLASTPPTHLSIYYDSVLFGYLSEQYFPVLLTFVAGDLMALTYIVIFYRYTHEKVKAHRVFLIFGTAVVLGTIYAFLSTGRPPFSTST
jgi:hypothetical protein